MMIVMKLLKNTYDAILSISWPTFPCRSLRDATPVLYL